VVIAYTEEGAFPSSTLERFSSSVIGFSFSVYLAFDFVPSDTEERFFPQ